MMLALSSRQQADVSNGWRGRAVAWKIGFSKGKSMVCGVTRAEHCVPTAVRGWRHESQVLKVKEIRALASVPLRFVQLMRLRLRADPS